MIPDSKQLKQDFYNKNKNEIDDYIEKLVDHMKAYYEHPDQIYKIDLFLPRKEIQKYIQDAFYEKDYWLTYNWNPLRGNL